MTEDQWISEKAKQEDGAMVNAGRLVEPLTKYFTYESMLCSDMRRAGSHPVVYLAAEVEGVLGECEDVLDMLVNLIPEIGELSKVQALLDRLKG